MQGDDGELSPLEQGTSGTSETGPLPVGPPPLPEEHRVSPLELLRLAALVAAVVLAVVASAVLWRSGGPPTLDELRAQAGLEGKQYLWVGVNGDVPGISDRRPDGSYRGFDVDIAYLVAKGLGYQRWQVRFVDVTTENRQRMIGLEPGATTYRDLDLVVAAYSITEGRRKEGTVFAGPYLRTETTVLTRRDHAAVESLSDLGAGGPRGTDEKDREAQLVCTPGTSTSAQRLRAESRALVIKRQRNSECVRLLLDGAVDAVVTDAAILAGFAAEHPEELKLNNISATEDEWWGIGVGYDLHGTDPVVQARRKLVLLTLADMLRRDAWSVAYDRNLRVLEPAVAPEPGEAPQQIASDRQPAPEATVEVRRWPWERLAEDEGP